MITKQYAEDEGVFSATIKSSTECRACHTNNVKCSIWESSDGAYEDYKYTCLTCGACWWIDGIDS